MLIRAALLKIRSLVHLHQNQTYSVFILKKSASKSHLTYLLFPVSILHKNKSNNNTKVSILLITKLGLWSTPHLWGFPPFTFQSQSMSLWVWCRKDPKRSGNSQSLLWKSSAFPVCLDSLFYSQFLPMDALSLMVLDDIYKLTVSKFMSSLASPLNSDLLIPLSTCHHHLNI